MLVNCMKIYILGELPATTKQLPVDFSSSTHGLFTYLWLWIAADLAYVHAGEEVANNRGFVYVLSFMEMQEK